VRGCFPSLSASSTFLDNAAGSMVPARVVAAVAGVLSARGCANALPGYAAGRAQTALKEAAHEATALFLNATPGEVAIGPSATAMSFRLAAALASRLVAGDGVVVSELEHECNASPWRDIAARGGLELRVWRARWPRCAGASTGWPRLPAAHT
jgi:selenocysteine lyase/cysteine desulfurase